MSNHSDTREEHQSNCRWQLTTIDQCEYRNTHYYCPHEEHSCTCTPEEPDQTLRQRFRDIMNTHTTEQGVNAIEELFNQYAQQKANEAEEAVAEWFADGVPQGFDTKNWLGAYRGAVKDKPNE